MLIPTPVKIIIFMIAIMGAGVIGFYQGKLQGDLAIANHQAEANKKIADLTAKNLEITTSRLENFNTKETIIREKEILYKDAAESLKPTAELSNGWISLHDSAAKLANPDMKMAADSAPSGVMDNAALSVVVSNYAICKSNADQLTELQGWIRDNQAAVDKINKKRKDK